MPTTNNLTDADCRKAQPGEKEKKIFDGGGLYLCVTPNGSKVWRLAYRYGGKPKTMSFGPYPLLTLAKAREKRDEAKRKLLDGIDPMAERKEKKMAIEAEKKKITLKEACDKYWDNQRDISDGYRRNAKRGIEMHIIPCLGNKDIRSITRDDLLNELNKMDASGLHVYVRKVRMWLGQVFGWAVTQGYAEVNQAQLIDSRKAFGKTKVESFAALELDDVPEFMRRISVENQHLLSVMGLKMLAYTWTRTGEMRQMKWSEINMDKAEWVIPAGKMKRARDHVVPLPRQAIKILEELQARRKDSQYVFPGEKSASRPMSENAVLYLTYRMGYKGTMTGHGWRSVASTWANSNKFNEDAIEMQLSHVHKDKVRAVYNRYRYIDERREMLQAHADWIESLIKG